MGVSYAIVAEGTSASAPEPGFIVDVVSGNIFRGEALVHVSEGVSQLLMLLAVHGDTSRGVVTDALWPELDGDCAANALKACIHRARLQLQNNAAITVERAIYQLGSNVQSTYPVVLEAVRAMGARLSEDQRRRYFDLFCRLSNGLSARRMPWAWFAPYARALLDALQALGVKLGDDALSRGDALTALQIARCMGSVDPLDEGASVLAIRAYGQLGNRTAARRESVEFSERVRRFVTAR